MKKYLKLVLLITPLLLIMSCTNIFDGFYEDSSSDNMEDLTLEGENRLKAGDNDLALDAFNAALEKYDAGDGTADLAIRAYWGKISAILNLGTNSGNFFLEVVTIMINIAVASDPDSENPADLIGNDPLNKDSSGEIDYESALERWTKIKESTDEVMLVYEKLLDLESLGDTSNEEWTVQFEGFQIDQVFVSFANFLSNTMVTVYENIEIFNSLESELGISLNSDFSNIDEVIDALESENQDIDMIDAENLTNSLDDLGITYETDANGIPTTVDTEGVDTSDNPFGDALLEALDSLGGE